VLAGWEQPDSDQLCLVVEGGGVVRAGPKAEALAGMACCSD